MVPAGAGQSSRVNGSVRGGEAFVTQHDFQTWIFITTQPPSGSAMIQVAFQNCSFQRSQAGIHLGP